MIALGSVQGTIKDVVDELRDGQGMKIGVLGIISFRPFPFEAVRAALAGASRVIAIERALAPGSGGIVTGDIRSALLARPLPVYPVIAGLGGRAVTSASLRNLLTDGHADALEPLTFLDLNTELVDGELARTRQARRSGPAAENMLRDMGAVVPDRMTNEELRNTVMPYQPIKFYQTGSFAVGNRLLDPEQPSVQSDTERGNSLNSGHRACQGCGEALGARYAIDTVMKATDRQMIAVNATGCLEVFSTPFPETSWQIPWLHSLFGNAPAVATGVAAAMRAKGRTDVRVVGP